MFAELDTVVLTHDIKNYGLKEGDVGTVVHTYDVDNAIEVEFITAKGETLALLTLNPTDIRPSVNEILHTREISVSLKEVSFGRTDTYNWEEILQKDPITSTRNSSTKDEEAVFPFQNL